MSEIPDFTHSELWVIETTLRERYGAKQELQLADGEIRLRPSDRELSVCPMVVWEHADCHFVVLKSAQRRYRSQFFYEGWRQYSTGVREYDDITTCVVATPQSQADQEATRRGDLS